MKNSRNIFIILITLIFVCYLSFQTLGLFGEKVLSLGIFQDPTCSSVVENSKGVETTAISNPTLKTNNVQRMNYTILSNVTVSSLSISGLNTVEIRKTIQLSAEVLPLDTTDKTVVWTSDNPLIASIDQTGLVSAVGVGKTNITATSNSDSAVFNIYQITVTGIVGFDYYNISTSVNDAGFGSIVLGNYDTQYGKTNSLTINANTGYKFLFLTENNKVVSFDTYHEFKVTNNASYKAYFIPDNMYYVLFMDQSRSLLKLEFCDLNANATAPASEKIPVIPGYTFSAWSLPFSNVVDNVITMPQYVKSITGPYNITVVNGTVSSISASYDETITVTASNKGTFKYWTRNNMIVSYNATYTFTVYGAETVTAVLGETTQEAPLASISPIIIDYDISEGLLSFVGSYSLPSAFSLVEKGMLVYQGILNDPLTVNTAGVSKTRVSLASGNNEFVVTLNGVKLSERWNVCTYVSYLDNGVIKYIYSNVLNYQKALSDQDTLSNIMMTIPTHIYDNYTFPTYEGLTWSYQEGSAPDLFNLATGTYTAVFDIRVAYRTVVATLNGHTATKIINFGIAAEEEVGKFYHDASTYVSLNTWTGWTLTKSNAVLFLITKVVEVEGTGTIGIKDLMSSLGSTNWSTAGSYIINKGSNSVSFDLKDATYDPVASVVRLGVLVSSTGEILNIISDMNATITLAPGQGLWTAKDIDKDKLGFGNASDFEMGTMLTIKYVRNVSGGVIPTISMSPTSSTVNQNETVTFVASIKNSLNTDVIYTSSNTSVATVNASTGVVTGVVEGTATITATSVSNPGLTASAIVTVNPAPAINVTPPTANLQPGASTQLTATITNSSNTAITWVSSNTNVATVNSASGLVTAVSVGNATITATAAVDSLLKATVAITVEISPTISMAPTAATINQNETVTVVATVQNLANTDVTYASSNTAIATVNYTTGVVTGVSQGIATITATSVSDSALKASATITVNPAATITVAPSTATLAINETSQLTTTINYLTIKTVTWTSDKLAIATVSASGLVTAKSAGTATITAKSTANASLTATATITVTPANYTINYNFNGGDWSWTSGTVTPASGIDSVSTLPEIFMVDFYQYLNDNSLLNASTVHETLRKTSWAEFSNLGGDPKASYNKTSFATTPPPDGYSQFFWSSISGTDAFGGFFGTEPFKTKYVNLLTHLTYMFPLKYSSSSINSDNGKALTGYILDGYFYATQGPLTGDFLALRGKVPTPTKVWNSTGTTSEATDYQVTTYPYGQTAQLRAPSRVGYVFDGWYNNAAFTGTAITSIAANVAPAATYYAKWSLPEFKSTDFTVNYVLDGGNWTYASREAMVNDFIGDFNTCFSKSVTASTIFNDTFGLDIASLFSNPIYSTKWGWMKSYIISVSETQAYSNVALLNSGDSAIWRSNLFAFLNSTQRTSWPASAYFSDEIAANGFWNTFPQNVFQYESILTTMPVPLKEDYVFVGWYDNAQFTGSPVTTVSATKTLYAKWYTTSGSTLTVTQSPTGFIEVGTPNDYQIYIKNSGGVAVNRTECTFVSSDSGIAVVSSFGTISVFKPGIVTIVVSHPTNGTGTITLQVKDPFDKNITFGSNPTTASPATVGMTNPFYWLRLAQGKGIYIDEVLLTTSEIVSQNTNMINQGNMRLISISTLANKASITSAELETLRSTFNYTLPNGWALQTSVQFAVVTSFSQMRSKPEIPADWTLNKDLLETGLEVGEGVAIYGKYSSGSWLLVRSQNYFGWIEASTVGTCTSTEMLQFANPSSFAIVTAERLKTNLGVPTEIRMGAKLPLISSTPSSATIRIPTRNSTGTLNISGDSVTIPIDNNEYVSVGYLPYTTKNIVKQMFKMLGQPYGWGDMSANRDCSSTIWTAYKCSGFLLPRNTTQQDLIVGSNYVKVTPTIGVSYDPHLTNLRMGSILLLKGHVTMYLGKVGERHYIIHEYGAGYCQVTDTLGYSFYTAKTFIK